MPAAFLGLSPRAWKLAAIIGGGLALLALLALLWGRGEHFKAEAAEAREQAALQVAEYRETYRKTFAEHFTAKLAEEARARAIKEQADADYWKAQLDARDRAAAYAERNRCMRAEATDPDLAGGPGVPGPAGPATLVDRPGAAAELAELIGISRADFDICTANSLRALNAHQWGEQLKLSPGGEP